MPIVYAWKIEEGLCYFAMAHKSLFAEKDKPSPEAKVTKCMLLEYKEYLKLKKFVNKK